MYIETIRPTLSPPSHSCGSPLLQQKHAMRRRFSRLLSRTCSLNRASIRLLRD